MCDSNSLQALELGVRDMSSRLTQTLEQAHAALDAAVDGLAESDGVLDDVLSARLLVAAAVVLVTDLYDWPTVSRAARPCVPLRTSEALPARRPLHLS